MSGYGSQALKLESTLARLGIDLSQMQNTTRRVYDTVATTAGAGTYEFFNSPQGKTIAETNLPERKLDAGDAMVIKEILFKPSAANIFGNRNRPIVNLYIGNNRVIEDLSFNFNQFDSYAAEPENFGGTSFPSMRLLTNIVLPPQMQLRATLQFSNATGAGTVKMICSGFGKLLRTVSL